MRTSWKFRCLGAALSFLAACSPVEDTAEEVASARQAQNAQAIQAARGTVDENPEAEIRGSLGSIPTAVEGRLARVDVPVRTGEEPSFRAALARIAPMFSLQGSELVVREVLHDDLGMTHVVLAQVKQGLPVVGGDLVVHLEKDGTVGFVNGTARDGVEVSAKPRLEGARARGLALKGEAPGLQRKARRLVYFISPVDRMLSLAWEVEVSGDGRLDLVYVDAQDGRQLDVHPQNHPLINRRIYTANDTAAIPGTLARSEGQGPTGNVTVDQNHDFMGVTYDCYASLFGRDSYDNAGSLQVSTVRHTNVCGFGVDNACWDSSRRQLFFGTGSGFSFGDLGRSLDIAAHEFTHGVTQFTSNLTYSGQSGGLNEAMSDIFAAVCEQRQDGGINADTWKVGEDAYTPSTVGDALRYMDDPRRDGKSLDHYADYTSSTDMHYSSGIANLAFKLMVTGGTHPRGRTSVVVPKLGIDRAARIFYRAQNNRYLTSSSTFQGARTATARAARELYGADFEAAVHLGWDAVGVPGSPGTPACNGGTGGWANGCRGTGCHVCSEKVSAYPCYFDNHPMCKLNTTCAGQFFLCNPYCPAPTEADTCNYVPPPCGDGRCEAGETCSSCAADCGACVRCGDGVCNGSESCSTCPSDCGSCCGDGFCDPQEQCSCNVDCGICGGFCGDGRCDFNEQCSCFSDCGFGC